MTKTWARPPERKPVTPYIDPLDEELRKEMAHHRELIDVLRNTLELVANRLQQVERTVKLYHPRSERNCQTCGKSVISIGDKCTYCGTALAG